MNVSKDAEKLSHSCVAGRNAKWYSHFIKQAVLRNYMCTHPIWPSNRTPGLLSQEKWKQAYTRTYIQMFIEALFLRAPNWN